MSEKETPFSNTERFPDLFYNSNNNQNITKQTIEERNKVIDDYLKSLDQIGNKKNEESSSSEDENDPFSFKAMKNLKPLKKSNNKLILPNFRKRINLKNEIAKRNNTSMPKNEIIDENISKKNKKLTRNKNLSDNNIIQKIVEGKIIYMGKAKNANRKNKNSTSSKWSVSSNTYNDYISFSNYNNKNCNLYKTKNVNGFKFNHINNSLNYKALIQSQIRSKSHIKQSYYLYKDKLSSFLKNKTINNYYKLPENNNDINKKMKYIIPKPVIIPYTNAGTNNLYSNLLKIEKNKRRNFTAKIIKNKIAIQDKIKKNKKFGNYRINSTLNNKHKKYEKLLQEKNNPYGLDWVNKLLKINTNGKLGLSKEFINGVPIVKIMGKGSLTKREMKKRLNDIEKNKKMEESKYNKIINAEAKLSEGKLDEDYNLPDEMMKQFNNKNAFTFRKDIIEKPDEEDQIIDE